MNYFQQKLAYSRGECERTDLEVLRNHIAGCVSVRKTTTAEDKKGVDYVVTLRRGAEIKIDAKTREPGCSKYWRYGEPELALETYSVVEKRIVGWTLDEKKEVDLILYTFNQRDSKVFYLLPFQHLRMAFRDKFAEWKTKYKPLKQENEGYHSEAIFVPASVVMSAINNICLITPNNLPPL